MKPNTASSGLLALAVPVTAQAYGASAGAIMEFLALCILIPFGIIVFFSTNYLKRKAPLALQISFALIGLLSIYGIYGMMRSFTTEVGYRPMVIGMHILLLVFVFLAARHIFKVFRDS